MRARPAGLVREWENTFDRCFGGSAGPEDPVGSLEDFVGRALRDGFPLAAALM